MLTEHATLAFPDFEKPFDLFTDACDWQLGATLVQDRKPPGFYTWKLNSAQLNCTVGEKELLGIIEGFKAFEGMIRGQELTVHTNNLNLLYQSMPSRRMVRWRLMFKEWHLHSKRFTSYNILKMHRICTIHALYKYNICTEQALYIHCTYTVHALYCTVHFEAYVIFF